MVAYKSEDVSVTCAACNIPAICVTMAIRHNESVTIVILKQGPIFRLFRGFCMEAQWRPRPTALVIAFARLFLSTILSPVYYTTCKRRRLHAVDILQT